MLRRNFLLALPTLAIAGPAFANGDMYVTEYRDKIIRLYGQLDVIPDDAPLADAMRTYTLRKIEWFRDSIMLPAFSPTSVQKALIQDPKRVIPQFAVPLEQQIIEQERRIGEAMIALMNDENRTLPALIDAASAEAAANKGFSTTSLTFLRMATIARMAKENARLGILRDSVLEMQWFIDQDAQQEQKTGALQQLELAYSLRGAGFVTEARVYANNYFAVRHGGPDPESVLGRAIINESNWHQGKISGPALDAQIRNELASVPAESKVYPQIIRYVRCHYQLLRFLNGAGMEDRMVLWINTIVALLDGLEPEKNPQRYRYALLVAELGRMGRSDLVLAIPYIKAGFYVGDWDALQVPDAEAVLQTPMLVAAYAGDQNSSKRFEERLLSVLSGLPALPDTLTLGRDSHLSRHMALAALAEVRAHSMRG